MDYEQKVSVQKHQKVTEDEGGMEAERDHLLCVQICGGHSGAIKIPQRQGKAGAAMSSMTRGCAE